MATNKAQIVLKIFNGARQAFSEKETVLLRVHNGQTMQFFTKTLNVKSLNEGQVNLKVDFFDNFADNYTILVTADGYRDTGFFPVRVSPQTPQNVSLMLIPSKPSFAFETWEMVSTMHPKIARFLSLSASSDTPQKAYEKNVMQRPREMACLLNLASAMSQIFLADGTPMDYFRAIEWDSLAQDRFFGYALSELVSQVKAGVPKKFFAPELDPSFFHGDATSSFKEIRFGEANVQLTFHEKDIRKIGGETCIRVESDIDFYKDLAAHALLEVLYNKLTNSLTDPGEAYVLRWIAGKQFGLHEFDPPYRLV